MTKMAAEIHGAFLVNKPPGISSFGVIESIKKIYRKQGLAAPKLGHGGTLDPFATGLLIVCIGRGVKLSRYFLGSTKKYEATLRFGETTLPGDPTDPISERSDHLPSSLEELNREALAFAANPYQQTPPMHSAKKLNGKPLYELARQGIEVERTPKKCLLHDFTFLSFDSPRANFRVSCSSGTYIRTLAKDFAIKLGTVGMLDSLNRTGSGSFVLENSLTLEDLDHALSEGQDGSNLLAFVHFDRLLDSFPRADARADEAEAIVQGKQHVLPTILNRRENDSLEHIAIYFENRLLAVAILQDAVWGLERVFPEAFVGKPNQRTLSETVF